MGWVVERTGSKRSKPKRRGRKKKGKELGRSERKEDAGGYAIIQVNF